MSNEDEKFYVLIIFKTNTAYFDTTGKQLLTIWKTGRLTRIIWQQLAVSYLIVTVVWLD